MQGRSLLAAISNIDSVGLMSARLKLHPQSMSKVASMFVKGPHLKGRPRSEQGLMAYDKYEMSDGEWQVSSTLLPTGGRPLRPTSNKSDTFRDGCWVYAWPSFVKIVTMNARIKVGLIC